MKRQLFRSLVILGILLSGCARTQKVGLLQIGEAEAISKSSFEKERRYASVDLKVGMALGMFVAHYDVKAVRDPACEAIENYCILNELTFAGDPHKVESSTEALIYYLPRFTDETKDKLSYDELRSNSFQVGLGVAGIVMASNLFSNAPTDEIDYEVISRLHETYYKGFNLIKNASLEIGFSNELVNELDELRSKAMSANTRKEILEVKSAIFRWGNNAADEIYKEKENQS